MKKTVFVMALLLAIGVWTVKAQNPDAAQAAVDEIEAGNHVKDDDTTRTADSDDDKTLTADASANGGARPELSKRPSFIWRNKGTGVTYALVYSGDETYGNVWMHQIGLANSLFITKNISYAIEANYWVGIKGMEVSGVNIPTFCQLDIGALSLEAGVQFDMLFGEYSTSVFNLGFVSGAGFSLGKHRLHKFFYRFNSGTAYCSHAFGIRMLF